VTYHLTLEHRILMMEVTFNHQINHFHFRQPFTRWWCTSRRSPLPSLNSTPRFEAWAMPAAAGHLVCRVPLTTFTFRPKQHSRNTFPCISPIKLLSSLSHQSIEQPIATVQWCNRPLPHLGPSHLITPPSRSTPTSILPTCLHQWKRK
jgi:hypothetical protein